MNMPRKTARNSGEAKYEKTYGSRFSMAIWNTKNARSLRLCTCQTLRRRVRAPTARAASRMKRARRMEVVLETPLKRVIMTKVKR